MTGPERLPLQSSTGEHADFVSLLRRRASRQPARIGLPETAEPRAREAAALLAETGWVKPELVPDGYHGALARLRSGKLDGVVAGAATTSADVLRGAIREIGLAAGEDTVSASFYLALPDGRVLTFTDPAVVPDPTPAQMSSAAGLACAHRSVIVGDQPVVAFLSYSTRGSATGPSVEKVREAARLFGELHPGVPSDGELQADAALVPSVAAGKAPGSPVGGAANVLVFPDLDCANIAYKLVQRLAGARALGPILQGLRLPVNDLSRGASVSDVVDVACVTALLAAGGGHG